MTVSVLIHDTMTGEQTAEHLSVTPDATPIAVLHAVLHGELDTNTLQRDYELVADAKSSGGRTLVWNCRVYTNHQIVATMQVYRQEW